MGLEKYSMPTLAATTTTTQTVTLKPSLRKKLLMALRTYVTLKETEKVAKAAKDKQRGIVGECLEEVGEITIKLEGFTATFVAPGKKVFDRKKFVELGGDLTIYDAAMINVDVKPYVKVSTGGSKDEE